MTIIPTKPVEMLKAFARGTDIKDALLLQYPELGNWSEEAREKEMRLWDEFLAAEDSSVLEENRARGIAVGYLVLTGFQLQNVLDGNRAHEYREQISKRFTEASKELYGEPEPEHVAYLAASNLKKVKSYVGKSRVDQVRVQRLIEFYSDQLGCYAPETADSMDEQLVEALDSFRDMLEIRYEKVFKIFDGLEKAKDKLPSEKVVEIFQQGLDILAETEPAWSEWEAVVGTSSSMSSDSYTREIKVGNTSRDPSRLKQLFGHEVLVHSLRAVNGSKTGDYMSEHGLPTYLDAEEGFTSFIQMAMSKKREPKKSDIYMNIGFALGALGRPSLMRSELQQIKLDMFILEKQAKGKEVDVADLVEKSWNHVNRIYRGSLGNEYIAVNTKDISYYQGFIKITHFIQEELTTGKTPDEIFDFLVLAKFDPTNERHINHVLTLYNKA